MQENIIQNLDKSLDTILHQLDMSFYIYNYHYYILDNKKMKKNGESLTYKGKIFKHGDNFFDKLINNYHTNVRIEKKQKEIYTLLYQVSLEAEKEKLLDYYEYFLNFEETMSYIEKLEGKKSALSFATKYVSKGKVRKADNEESLIMKIHTLDPDNFYENLLGYLSNHAEMYKSSMYCQSYQSILKNIINEYLPEKRKSFALFTGDSKKKYLDHCSILFENEKIECEIFLQLNKTVLQELYTPDKLKEKHVMIKEQNSMIQNIENLLKLSKRLNISDIYPIYTKDKEVISYLITKEKNDISKENIKKFIEASMLYWKENILELKNMEKLEMLQKVANNAEITFLHNSLSNKLETKGKSEKKVKI